MATPWSSAATATTSARSGVELANGHERGDGDEARQAQAETQIRRLSAHDAMLTEGWLRARVSSD